MAILSGKTDRDQYTVFLNLDDGIRVYDIIYGVSSADIVAALLKNNVSDVQVVLSDCNPIIVDTIRGYLPSALHIIPVEYWFSLVSVDFAEFAHEKLKWSSVKDKDTLVTFTPMECIRTGTFENRSKAYGDIDGSYTQYADGDIVLAKVTPCFENGNVCIMRGLHSGVGFGSSELFVLRPQKVLDRFLFYFLQHNGFKEAACSTMTGTGGLKRVSSSFIQNCYVPCPDTGTQETIADYLDEKSSIIHSLICEKESLIADLEAYKKSLIYEVVTGKKRVY